MIEYRGRRRSPFKATAGKCRKSYCPTDSVNRPLSHSLLPAKQFYESNFWREVLLRVAGGCRCVPSVDDYYYGLTFISSVRFVGNNLQRS